MKTTNSPADKSAALLSAYLDSCKTEKLRSELLQSLAFFMIGFNENNPHFHEGLKAGLSHAVKQVTK